MSVDSRAAILRSNMVQAIVTLANSYQGGTWRLMTVQTNAEFAMLIFQIDETVSIRVDIREITDSSHRLAYGCECLD